MGRGAVFVRFPFEPWRGVQIPVYGGLPRHMMALVDNTMDADPSLSQGDAVILVLGEIYGGQWALLAAQVIGSLKHGPADRVQ